MAILSGALSDAIRVMSCGCAAEPPNVDGEKTAGDGETVIHPCKFAVSGGGTPCVLAAFAPVAAKVKPPVTVAMGQAFASTVTGIEIESYDFLGSRGSVVVQTMLRPFLVHFQAELAGSEGTDGESPGLKVAIACTVP